MDKCGCEYGGDCTKTTVCAIDSALADQADRITELEAQLEAVRELLPLVKSMAEQRTTEEMDSEQLDSADFETAWDIMVNNSRDLWSNLVAIGESDG